MSDPMEQDGLDCMDCGMCPTCIMRTMEATHDAEITRLRSENEALRAERDAERNRCLQIIDAYWTFDNNQQHRHSWHSMQDAKEKIRSGESLHKSTLKMMAERVAEKPDCLHYTLRLETDLAEAVKSADAERELIVAFLRDSAVSIRRKDWESNVPHNIENMADMIESLRHRVEAARIVAKHRGNEDG